MTAVEIMDALERGLTPRPDALDDDRARAIVAEVADFYRRIRRPDEELAEPFRAGGEWKVYVDSRREIYDAAVRGDVDTLAPRLRDFWRDELLGPIVSQYSYFPALAAGDEEKTGRFTQSLARDYAYWRSLFKDEDPQVLEFPRVGNPWGLELDGVLVSPRSLRFDAMARQITELLRDVDGPVVTDIGGGFGGMGDRLMRFNARITYVDFDLPETLMIAAYYLRTAFPDRDVVLWDPEVPLDREALRSHDVVLAPHYAIAELAPDSVDLFLNMFSLSEMRWEALSEYMRVIARSGRRYFLQNNVDRTGVVNRGYERTPCSRFPLDRSAFKTLYHRFDTFQGPEGDYRESLHERIVS
jgi:hypothetical protein